jgi:hypothetical protein
MWLAGLGWYGRRTKKKKKWWALAFGGGRTTPVALGGNSTTSKDQNPSKKIESLLMGVARQLPWAMGVVRPLLRAKINKNKIKLKVCLWVVAELPHGPKRIIFFFFMGWPNQATPLVCLFVFVFFFLFFQFFFN